MPNLRGPRLEALWEVYQACRRFEVAWAEGVASWASRMADRGLALPTEDVGLVEYRAARQRVALARTMLNLEQHGTFDSPFDRPVAAVAS